MTESYGASFTAQAMLCDSAVAVDGKLYVQGGGWNVVAAPKLPFVVPRIGIALLLGVPYGATDREHQLSVGLADEDGEQLPLGPMQDSGRLTHITVGFGVGRPALIAPGDSQLVPIALNIDGYTLTRPGGYAFAITVDGTEVTRLQFRVHERPA